MSYAFLSNIDVSVSVFRRLAAALGVTVSEILAANFRTSKFDVPKPIVAVGDLNPSCT